MDELLTDFTNKFNSFINESKDWSEPEVDDEEVDSLDNQVCEIVHGLSMTESLGYNLWKKNKNRTAAEKLEYLIEETG